MDIDDATGLPTPRTESVSRPVRSATFRRGEKRVTDGKYGQAWRKETLSTVRHDGGRVKDPEYGQA